MNDRPYWLLGLLAIVALWFTWFWWMAERRRSRSTAVPAARARPADFAVGGVLSFFDTLGVGAFAPTTAVYKALRRMPDDLLPGTLNVGYALPTVLQALIFIVVVKVDMTTLGAMVGASVLGSLLGMSLVVRAPRRAIQLVMGIALLVAAGLFVARNLELLPAGGVATGLSGAPLALAVVITFCLGGLMMAGVGFYAPCLLTVSLLGMNPIVAFPIMMTACGLLQPIGGHGFIRSGRYHLWASVALTLAGIPAVLIAAFVVKSMPLEWLRWLVVVAALVAGGQMLTTALARRAEAPGENDVALEAPHS